MNYELVNAGSVKDIRGTLKCHPDSYTVKDLERQIELEKADRNRSSVIKLLEATIKRKQKQNK